MTNAVRSAEILERLFRLIESRKGGDPAASYTAKLLADGKGRAAKKLGEEATETVIAAMAGTPSELVRESADLLYHLLVLLAAKEVKLEEVEAKLRERHSK